MFLKKKIISAVAAVAMMLTSFGAVTVSAATDPKLVVTIENDKSNLWDQNATMGVIFTLECDPSVTYDSLQVNVNLPTNLMQYYAKGGYKTASEVSTMEASLFKYDASMPLGKTSRQFMDTGLDVGENLVNVMLTFSVTTGGKMGNGDYFEFDFKPAMDWSEAPVGSFKITKSMIGEDKQYDAVELAVDNQAEVKAPAETGTPSIGGTDKDAVENFAGYVAADNLGVFTNPDLATDKAVAFKTAVTGTTATGDVVWKVTSGGISKYHKMSIGSKLTGGGEAVIGLAVEGLDDSAATAGVAFLQ